MKTGTNWGKMKKRRNKIMKTGTNWGKMKERIL